MERRWKVATKFRSRKLIIGTISRLPVQTLERINRTFNYLRYKLRQSKSTGLCDEKRCDEEKERSKQEVLLVDEQLTLQWKLLNLKKNLKKKK